MSPSFALDARESIIRLSKRVNAQSRPAETKPDLPLEIAHLLLIDVVGYSKLLVNEQIELLQGAESNRAKHRMFSCCRSKR